MKYLCLVYLEEAKLRAVADTECQACGDGFHSSDGIRKHPASPDLVAGRARGREP